MRVLSVAALLAGVASATPLAKFASQAVLDLLPGSEPSDRHYPLVRPVDALKHVVPDTVVEALAAHPDDPVAALLYAQPERAAELAEPRLLEVSGSESAVWMTEGDKLRLRQEGTFFLDVTDREELQRKDGAIGVTAGNPSQSLRIRLHNSIQ